MNAWVKQIGSSRFNRSSLTFGQVGIIARDSFFGTTVITGGGGSGIPISVNVSNVWHLASSVSINIGGTWKTGTVSINVGGTWKSS